MLQLNNRNFPTPGDRGAPASDALAAHGATAVLVARVRGLLPSLLRRSGVPGISVTIAHDQAAHTVCIGRSAADRDLALQEQARFRIGCLHDLLTNLILLKLAHAGALSLDAPLADYLPELGSCAAGQLRVPHLLSHTSGFQPLGMPDSDAPHATSWARLVEYLHAAAMLFEPGAVFNYHIFDHILLRRILEQVAQQRLAQVFCREFPEVMAAACAGSELDTADHLPGPSARSYVVASDALATETHGGLDIRLSTEALAKLASDLIAWQRMRNEESWHAAAAGWMTTRVIAIPRSPQPAWQQQVPVSYGLGCARFADGSHGYRGSARGQCCALQFDPASGLAVAVAINARAPWIRDGIVRTLMEGLSPSVPAEQAEPVCDERAIAAIEGVYIGAHEGTRVTVRSAGTELVIALGDAESPRREQIALPRDSIRRTEDGYYARGARARMLFFAEPGTGAPCLMCGWQAFKRA